MDKTQNKLQEAIKYILSAAAFLVPIFFLPVTLEKFEFNKLSLLVVLVSSALIIWAADVVIRKEIKIAKTALDLPGILLLSAVLLSTIFSIDKSTSIFGRSNKWFGSLLSFFTLSIFYILITTGANKKKDIKTMLYSFLFGTTLGTVITILSYYGISIIEGTDQNFSPTGSIFTLSILSVITITAALYEFLKEKDMALKVFTAVVLLTNLTFIVLYNKPITWILLGIAAALVLLTSPELNIKSKEQRLPLLLVGIMVTSLIGLTSTPLTEPIFVRHTYPSPVKLPFRESWNVAVSAMRDFPLVGTGPSTFYLNYPRYKSTIMNQTEYWNIRFDKPYNEAFVVIGTLGILGILAAAYFDVAIIKKSLKNLGKTDVTKVLAIVTLLLLGVFALTYASFLTAFTFVLFLGMFVAAADEENKDYLSFSTMEPGKSSATSLASLDNENSAFLTAIMAIPLLTAAGLGLFALYKIYPSEYYMQQGIEALDKNVSEGYQKQAKAIGHNSKRDGYYNTYAQTNLAMAINLSQKEDLTDTEREALQNLIATAIRASQIATETVNPLNPVNWEVRAGIYRAIRGAAQDADQWALRALETAMQLDPNNPQLRLETGGIYYANQDYLTAANYFRQATQLKPDYANAYYNFAQAVKNLEQYASAKRALELTLSLVPQGSEDYATVEREISDLEGKLAAASEEEAKPSVEELATQAQIEESGTTENQEPLAIEGEEEEIVETVDLDAETAVIEEEEETEEASEEEEILEESSE